MTGFLIKKKILAKVCLKVDNIRRKGSHPKVQDFRDTKKLGET